MAHVARLTRVSELDINILLCFDPLPLLPYKHLSGSMDLSRKVISTLGPSWITCLECSNTKPTADTRAYFNEAKRKRSKLVKVKNLFIDLLDVFADIDVHPIPFAGNGMSISIAIASWRS